MIKKQKVRITSPGMRQGCIGFLESTHGDWEFLIRFLDGNFSYFMSNEFELISD